MTVAAVICRCGAALVGTPHLPPACGHCGLPTPTPATTYRDAPPAASPPADPLQRLPPLVTDRYRICQSCPHVDGYRCRLLVATGRPGLLFHRRGLWRPESHCPDGRW